MDRRTFLKSTGASMLSASVPAALPAMATDGALESALSAIADRAVEGLAAPGIQISVWKHGAPAAQAVRGFGNIETASPVTATTIFRAGSITKQFTAALIATLQDQGRLSVNDPLGKHLDFFKGRESPTLLELIHHTAGVHEEQTEHISQAPTTQQELARLISEQERLYDFPPGTAWLYSNANYILLGAVVESVTGRTLADAAHQILFGPLGLTRTAFDNHADVVPHRASGYTGTQTMGRPFANAGFIAIDQTGGAGAVRSTAGDLCRWHTLLFDSTFLSPSARNALVEPARLRDGRPATKGRFNPDDDAMGETGYGYGLLLDRSTRDHGVIAMHNGFVSGFSTYLATHVPSRTTVACMCNADPNQELPFRALRKTVFANSL